jgi:predicted DNA-binding protein (UPF0251 family)/predicted Fe-Mo cluster-binding NifX family protein
MARNKKDRYINGNISLTGFTPVSNDKLNGRDSIIINREEYEAIKLCDYDLLNQAEAAEIIGVSRPTLTRIYENARRKVAKAFTEGREIIFAGDHPGNDEWEECNVCHSQFSNVHNGKLSVCPLCSGADKIIVSVTADAHPYTMVDPNFGRCHGFAIIEKFNDSENNYSCTIIPNKLRNGTDSAGTGSAAFVADSGAVCAIAGNFGAKASAQLRNHNIIMLIPKRRILLNEIMDMLVSANNKQ